MREGNQTENRPNLMDQRTKPKQPRNQKEDKKLGVSECDTKSMWTKET